LKQLSQRQQQDRFVIPVNPVLSFGLKTSWGLGRGSDSNIVIKVGVGLGTMWSRSVLISILMWPSSVLTSPQCCVAKPRLILNSAPCYQRLYWHQSLSYLKIGQS